MPKRKAASPPKGKKPDALPIPLPSTAATPATKKRKTADSGPHRAVSQQRLSKDDAGSDSSGEESDASDSSSSEAESHSDDQEDEEVPSEVALLQKKGPDAKKLRGKLHHHVKTVRSAAKKARAFERQRVVKKLKAARAGKNAGGSDESTLASELEVLKTIQTAPIAASALLSKMAKSKLVPRGVAAVALAQGSLETADQTQYPLLEASLAHADLGPLLRAGPEHNPHTATDVETRAKARLNSSKILADAVVSAVADLLALTSGLPSSKATAKDSKASTVPSEQSSKDAKREVQDTATGRPSVGVTKGRAWLEAREWSGEESGDDEEEGTVIDKESDISGGQTDSKESSDAEQVEDQDMEAFGEEWDEFVASASSQGDESDSGEESTRSLEAQPPQRKPRRRASSSASSASSAASDANLPALATGFVPNSLRLRKGDDDRGTDDSFSDDEGGEGIIDSDAEEGGTAKGSQKPGATRKNRRGQRARKAIWEKKYGRNANHVKLQLKEQRKAAAAERRSGTAASASSARPRRGAPLPGTPWDKPAAGQGWGGRTPGQSIDAKAPPTKTVPPTTQSEQGIRAAPQRQQRSLAAASKMQEMHPSWTAKQRQKEIAASAARGGTGTKVTFGDDGARSSARPAYVAPTGGRKDAPPASKPEELHPSWIAKQKQKELLAKAASGLGGGKKITFD